MRRIFQFVFLPFAGLLLLQSCRKDKDDPVVIVTTDPEFQVDLFEQRDESDGHPVFGLWIRSVAKFPCSNYLIDYESLMSGSNILIRLNDVYAADTCQSGFSPAQVFVPIGNLLPGTYRFSLTLGNAIENNGTLNVFENRYELSIDQPQAIDFQNLVLNKMPEGTLWGYAVTPDAASAERGGAFLADLKNITAEHNLPAGFYSYFTISGTGLIAPYPGFVPAGPIQFFVRKSISDPQNLQTLLQQYRSTPQNALQIRCLTTTGGF